MCSTKERREEEIDNDDDDASVMPNTLSTVIRRWSELSLTIAMRQPRGLNETGRVNNGSRKS